MSVRGTTTVAPSPNGCGCETCGCSVMRMVRLPCAIATVETRHVLAHDDDPRRLVDDHPCWQVGLDAELFDVGDQVDDAAVVVIRQGDLQVLGSLAFAAGSRR
jgi:hypothetical protein